jgi:DNA-directed RNA polymerase specialized sigma24 family protein
VAADRDRRDEALDQLPLPYSTALRLRDAGIPNEVIAECVGVEPEAIATLLRLAEAKLAATGYSESASRRR